MREITLCIPTMLAYDLCVSLIASAERGTIKPTKYAVIDNGVGFHEYLDTQITDSNLRSRIDIYSPGKNIGVAASWNHFLKHNDGIVIISNDDIEFYSDTLESMLKVYDEKREPMPILFSLLGLNAFSLFITNNSILKIIGPFDENFYPAYFEDNDYCRRMQLLKYIIHHINIPIIHHGSATLKEQQKIGKIDQHHENFRKNQAYFIEKWGGLPGHEKYKTPFNK